MNGSARCLIWNTEAEELPRGSEPGSRMDSPRAGGPYFMSESGWRALHDLGDVPKSRLTSWLVEQRRMGEQCPEVTAEVVEDVRRRPPLSVPERADRLLKCLSRDLEDVADMFTHREPDDDELRRMAWTESLRLEEVTYLVAYLKSSAWIEHVYTNVANIYRITVEGYARLAELDRTATDSSKAFVAMWFDESMDDVWENAIEPGIEDAGYEPVRIDRKEHLNKIDDESSPSCGVLVSSSPTSRRATTGRAAACTTRQDSRTDAASRSYSRAVRMRSRRCTSTRVSTTTSCGRRRSWTSSVTV